jgi:hypothetical protein
LLARGSVNRTLEASDNKKELFWQFETAFLLGNPTLFASPLEILRL